MIKIISFLLATVMVVAAFASCGERKEEASPVSETASETEETTVTTEETNKAAEETTKAAEETTKATEAETKAQQSPNDGIVICDTWYYQFQQGGDYTFVMLLENTLSYTVDIKAEITFGYGAAAEKAVKKVKHLASGGQFAINVVAKRVPQDYEATFDVSETSVVPADSSKLNATIGRSGAINYITLENNCDYAVKNVEYTALYFDDSGRLLSSTQGAFEDSEKDKSEGSVIQPGETVSKPAGLLGTKYVVYLNGEKVIE